MCAWQRDRSTRGQRADEPGGSSVTAQARAAVVDGTGAAPIAVRRRARGRVKASSIWATGSPKVAQAPAHLGHVAAYVD